MPPPRVLRNHAQSDAKCKRGLPRYYARRAGIRMDLISADVVRKEPSPSYHLLPTRRADSAACTPQMWTSYARFSSVSSLTIAAAKSVSRSGRTRTSEVLRRWIPCAGRMRDDMQPSVNSVHMIKRGTKRVLTNSKQLIHIGPPGGEAEKLAERLAPPLRHSREAGA